MKLTTYEDLQKLLDENEGVVYEIFFNIYDQTAHIASFPDTGYELAIEIHPEGGEPARFCAAQWEYIQGILEQITNARYPCEPKATRFGYDDVFEYRPFVIE